MTRQKRFRVINTFHKTEAGFLAPDYCQNAGEAWGWLLDAAWASEAMDRHDGPRRTLARVQRKLCPDRLVSCRCTSMIRGIN